jgi:hypothetical protein
MLNNELRRVSHISFCSISFGELSVLILKASVRLKTQGVLVLLLVQLSSLVEWEECQVPEKRLARLLQQRQGLLQLQSKLLPNTLTGAQL